MDGSGATSDPCEPTSAQALNADLMVRIYQDADAIMHSRVQSYMLAQTFLILAFATVVVNVDKNDSLLYVCLCICLVGIVSSNMLRSKMISINQKMRAFRVHLKSIPEYALYFGNGIERINNRNNSYIVGFPRLIDAAWIVLAGLAVKFWWESAPPAPV